MIEQTPRRQDSCYSSNKAFADGLGSLLTNGLYAEILESASKAPPSFDLHEHPQVLVQAYDFVIKQALLKDKYAADTVSKLFDTTSHTFRQRLSAAFQMTLQDPLDGGDGEFLAKLFDMSPKEKHGQEEAFRAALGS